MQNENTPTEVKDSAQLKASPRYVTQLVLALLDIRRMRFGVEGWDNRYRWIWMPWKWAHRKSSHGGWFYLTWRFPIEVVVGVKSYARWQNKRSERAKLCWKCDQPKVKCCPVCCGQQDRKGVCVTVIPVPCWKCGKGRYHGQNI